LERQFVSGLKDKTSVTSIYLVKDKALQTGKTGKTYVAFSLADRTGSVEARIWDNAENWFEQFDVDDFVDIKGFVQTFQGRRQLVVSALEVVSPGQLDLSDFLPSSKRDPNEVYAELAAVLSKIRNPFLKELVRSTLEDPQIGPLFRMAPAAKTIHHAYIGGLMEHVLSIANIMVSMKTNYPHLDLDLLLVGAVFHDIGKVWELSFETSFGYTQVGRLVGHIPLGSELIEKKASQIQNFPFELRNICKHLVLSHHGKIEYGSPKLPMTIEAFLVAYVDDLDSKMESIWGLINADASSGQRWTRFSSLYGRHFMIPEHLLPGEPADVESESGAE
jgi:3'-5' exoribonuclease